MSAEQTVYAAVSASSPVTAIVADRIYSQNVPVEKTLPAVSIRRVSTEFCNTIHSSVPAGAFVTLEVACMAEKLSQTHILADAVQLALGTAGISPQDRVYQEETEQGLYAVVLLVKAWE